MPGEKKRDLNAPEFRVVQAKQSPGVLQKLANSAVVSAEGLGVSLAGA